MGDEFDFGGSFDSFDDYGTLLDAGYDFGGFENIGGDILSNMDLGSDFSFDPGALDVSDFSNYDFGGIEDILAQVDPASFGDWAADLGGLGDYGFAGYDLGALEDLAAVDALRDLPSEGLTRSLFPPAEGITAKRVNIEDPGSYRIPVPSSGEGLRLSPVGRGQVALVDPQTGAQGLIGEGFLSGKDLRGAGTAEEIARYTPGTADYGLRSGFEAPGGLGMTGDATRGMGLTDMGGAQGLTKYIPAEYNRGTGILEELIARNPGKFADIEEYLNSKFDIKGEDLRPYRGTGGTLTSSGFLAQSSAANPLGAMYSIGDPKSFINRPSVTGQQASVSPGRTVINQGNGTYKIVETKNNTTTERIVDSKGNTIGGSGAGAATQQPKDLLGSLLPLLLMMMAMRGQGGGGGSSAVIPALTATQKQTPYTQQQQAPGYRPGQGGITYFNPVQYAPKAAGGAITMAGGGIVDLARALAAKRREQRQGLLKGRGDGVSDSIPAMIGKDQPARLARGEYVVDARTVAELGNGSTDAGAERLDEMRKRVHAKRKKAGVGQDSKAYKTIPA